VFTRNVDWNLFQVFHEIVRCGSISAAARALRRQQPSVSASLKRLETHLQTDLCHRTNQGIELTPAGRALHAICEQMLAHVRAVPNEVAKAAGALEGVITLQTISNLICPALDAAVSRFHDAYPKVEIKLDVAPWRAVLRALSEGQAQIGIACDDAPSGELRYEPLMRETQQLYCSSRHPLFGKPPCRPADLTGEPFVLAGDDEPADVETFRRRHGLGQQVGGFSENLHEVRWLIEMGVGVGFLPTVIGASPVEQGRLWPLLPHELLPSYLVYVITRRQPGRDAPAQLLLEMLQTGT
jgi:LysR family transcriptional regulator, transcriptional activator for bauABCD operon